ncbi:MAG: hypothetical protein H0V88_05055 [Pyrinomonadaceae bacterium]|nr:hypothetical protein [Pyrinomonadaceae bacterium]
MENQLIQIYLLVCQIYDTSSDTCFQRLSNNSQPAFTDQELLAIWFFAHLNGFFEKKQMLHFIQNYWSDWFPQLPSCQTFVLRLNQLEATFHTFGRIFSESLATAETPLSDRIVDSMPVMLAQHGHSYRARVAREVANVGYWAAIDVTLSWRSLARFSTAPGGTLANSGASVAVRRLASRLESL